MSNQDEQVYIKKLSDGKAMIVESKQSHYVVTFVDNDERVMRFDFSYNTLSDLDIIIDSLIPIATDLTVRAEDYGT